MRDDETVEDPSVYLSTLSDAQLVALRSGLTPEIERRSAEHQRLALMLAGTVDQWQAQPQKRRPSRAAVKRTVAPKFRDPVTGKTWAGRGLKPSWVRDEYALNGGGAGHAA